MTNGLALLILGAALCWAAVGLALATRGALGGGPPLHALAAGDPRRGARHMLVTANDPRHKESVRLHPASFALGALLHLSLFGSLLGLPLLLLDPPWSAPLRVPFAALALAGAVASMLLLVRRGRGPVLRALSVPDDYVVEVLAAVVLLTLAAGALRALPLWSAVLAVSLLLVYVPVGKLRHMVFFFIVRANLGRRLGYRGVVGGRDGSRA